MKECMDKRGFRLTDAAISQMIGDYWAEVKMLGAKNIADLKRVTSVKHDGPLPRFPLLVAYMTKLISLSLTNAGLTSVPDVLETAKALRILNLSHNELSEFPHAVLKCSGLQTLNLAGNQISSVPYKILRLRVLRVLVLDANKITVLPVSVGYLPLLNTLSLQDNPIEELPPTLGRPDLKVVGSKVLISHHAALVEHVQTTDWQEWCFKTDFGAPKAMADLRRLSKTLFGDGKTLEEMCEALDKDYVAFTGKRVAERKKRECTNPTTIYEGDEYDTLPDEDVLEFLEDGTKYCFTLDEMKDLKTRGINPYTRRRIPEEVWTEMARKVEERTRKENPERRAAHTLKSRFKSSRGQLKEVLSSMSAVDPHIPTYKLLRIAQDGRTMTNFIAVFALRSIVRREEREQAMISFITDILTALAVQHPAATDDQLLMLTAALLAWGVEQYERLHGIVT